MKATKQRLQELAGVRPLANEGINFALPTASGDPNTRLFDSFKIIFKDVKRALDVINSINADLKSSGSEPIEWIFGGKERYDRLEIRFVKPTTQQMQSILDAFSDSDIESIGRV